MSDVEIIAVAKQALTTVLLVAGPALGFGLLVGLIIGIFKRQPKFMSKLLRLSQRSSRFWCLSYCLAHGCCEYW